MKKTQKKDWRLQSLERLLEELKKLKKETIDAVLEKKIGKLANLREPRQKRKDIATLLTIISEKKFLENLEGQKKGQEDAKDK